MTYRLYITNKNYSSWSLRPWILLRQLGIPFTEYLRPLVPGSFRQPQWLEFSPTAHVPCLHVLPDNEDGREEGGKEPPLVLWESVAIVEFLAEAHPDRPVYPRDRAARAWARSAVAEMHAGFAAVRRLMSMNVGVRLELAPGVADGHGDAGGGDGAALAADLDRLAQLWAEGLRRFGGPFLAGAEFTAVDAFYAPVVFRLQTYAGPLERMGDEVREYVRMMLGLDGMREWEEAALRETAREPCHEAELLEGGGKRLIADLRAK